MEIVSNFLPLNQWIHCAINVNEIICSSNSNTNNTSTNTKWKEINAEKTFKNSSENTNENTDYNASKKFIRNTSEERTENEKGSIEKTVIELFIDGNLVKSDSIDGGRCPVYRNVIIGTIPSGLNFDYSSEDINNSDNCGLNNSSDNNNICNNSEYDNDNKNNDIDVSKNNNNSDFDDNQLNNVDINDEYNNNNIDNNDVKSTYDTSTQNSITTKNLNNENSKNENEHENVNKNEYAGNLRSTKNIKNENSTHDCSGIFIADMYWFPSTSSSTTSTSTPTSNITSSPTTTTTHATVTATSSSKNVIMKTTPTSTLVSGPILSPKKRAVFENFCTQDPPSISIKSSRSALYSSTALFETSTTLYLSKLNDFMVEEKDIDTMNSIFEFFVCLLVCGDNDVMKRCFCAIKKLILNIFPQSECQNNKCENKNDHENKKYAEKANDIKNKKFCDSIELLLNRLLDLVAILINSSASFNILNFEYYEDFHDFQSVTHLWSKRNFINSNNLESEFRASNWSNSTSINSNYFLYSVTSLIVVAFQRNFIDVTFFDMIEITEFEDENINKNDVKNDNKNTNNNNNNMNENKNEIDNNNINDNINNRNTNSAKQLISLMCTGGMCQNLDLNSTPNTSRTTDIFRPKNTKYNTLNNLHENDEECVDRNYSYYTDYSQFSQILSMSTLNTNNEDCQFSDDEDITQLLSLGELYSTVEKNSKSSKNKTKKFFDFSFPNIQNLEEKILMLAYSDFYVPHVSTPKNRIVLEGMNNNDNNYDKNNNKYCDNYNDDNKSVERRENNENDYVDNDNENNCINNIGKNNIDKNSNKNNNSNSDNDNENTELFSTDKSKIFEETSLILAKLRCLLIQVTTTTNKMKETNNKYQTEKQYSALSKIMKKNISNLISIASYDPVKNMLLFLKKAKSSDLASILNDIIKYGDILFIEKLYLRLWKVVRVQKMSCVTTDNENNENNEHKQVEENNKNINNRNNIQNQNQNNNMNSNNNQELNPLRILWYNGIKGDDNCPIILLGGDVHITDGTKVRAALHFSSIASTPHTAINLNAMHGRWFYEVTDPRSFS